MKRFSMIGLPVLMLVLLVSGFSAPAIAEESASAPTFRGKDLEGKEHVLEQFGGSHLVLYFWATWCPACRADSGSMKKVAEAFKPKGVQFLSVSLDRDENALRAFVKENNFGYPVIFDGKGWDNAVAQKFGIVSTPTFIVIDPQGKIRGVGSWAEDLGYFLKKNISCIYLAH